MTDSVGARHVSKLNINSGVESPDGGSDVDESASSGSSPSDSELEVPVG